jgi:hypothetical protein
VEFLYGFVNGGYPDQLSQWIGLRENLQESPIEKMGKSMVSGFDFPLNQSIDYHTIAI